MSFINELKRRNVFRVMIAYTVAAWILVEGMELLTSVFEAPDWVMKVFVGVAVFGFLPVIIFSWVYEITPEGIKKEASDHPEHTRASSNRLNIAILVMLALAVGLLGYERFSGDTPVVPPGTGDAA